MSKNKQKSKSKRKPSFWQQDRLWRIIGLFLLLFGFYLFISILSYVVTFSEDYSWVAGNHAFNASEVKNWLGPVGAYLAHIFSGRLFGLASFGFVFIFFVFGTNFLFSKRIFKPLSTSAHTLVVMMLLSLSFTLLKTFGFNQMAYEPGGAWGSFLVGSDGMLIRWIKPVGAIALVVFLWIAYAIWQFRLRPEAMLRYFFKRGKENSENQKGTSIIQNDETLLEKDGIEKSLEESEDEDKEDNEDTVTTEISTEENKNDDSDNMSLEVETNQKEEEVEEEEAEPELEVNEYHEEEVDERAQNDGNYDPTADLSSYSYPPLDLLDKYGDGKLNIDKEELEANKDRIVETLRNYNIEISKIKATIGPTITLYEIIPAKGIRISKIKNLEDDIALSLAALGIRIIAPIPGKGTIGIEVPNAKKEIVSSRSVLTSKVYRETDFELPIALGKTISNDVFMVDLAKMPHMLMAGATGAG